jgi:hypothetical protein
MMRPSSLGNVGFTWSGASGMSRISDATTVAVLVPWNGLR